MKNILKTSFENILSQGDKNYIYVIEDGVVKKLEVKTGLSSTFETQIISKDVNDKMLVVKNPDDTLVDGEKVKIKEPDQNSVQGVTQEQKQEAPQSSSETK